MLKYVVGYLGVGLLFAAMDFCWLSVMGQRLYKAELGDLLAPTVRLAPGALFYVVYMIAVIALCVAPAVREGRWTVAPINGVILGLAAYATYDLTNQATMRIWSTKVTVLDLGWGMFVTAVTASAGVFIVRWAGRAFGGN